jgi:hypothetical protein
MMRGQQSIQAQGIADRITHFFHLLKTAHELRSIHPACNTEVYLYEKLLSL